MRIGFDAAQIVDRDGDNVVSPAFDYGAQY
jgi:hypothetical protein